MYMRRTHVLVVGVSLVLVAGLAFVIGRATTPSTTTTSLSVPTTSIPESQPQVAIWPFATSATRYTDPVTAAFSFAVQYLGFTSPLVGDFHASGHRSGDVPVRTSPGGEVTTVAVRQLTSDHTWWVVSADAPTLRLDEPVARATVSSPVTLSGQSTAFEAVVNVAIVGDGSVTPVATDVVMGGSMGETGPFHKAISFATPTVTGGAVVLRTRSAKDGSYIAATARRVAFAH